MDMQHIRTSLFHVFMGTLLDFFVYLIRGFQSMMAAPIYEQFRAATQFKEPETIWLRTVGQQKHQHHQPQRQQQRALNKTTAQMNKSGKVLLNALPSEPLAIIQLVDALIFDDISNKLSTCPIAKSKHEGTLPKQMEATTVAANNLYDLCSEPTFCYFFVDVKSRKCAKDVKNYQSTTAESSPSQRRQLIDDVSIMQSSDNCARIPRTELETVSSKSNCSSDESDNDNVDENYPATQLPKSLSFDKNVMQRMNICRQRTISECSDDSFICFVDEDDDEQDKYAKPYQTDSESESEADDDDDDNEDDDDDSEDDEFVIIKKQEKNSDCTNSNKNKQVRFNLNPEIHVMHAWNFAYRSARKGEWQVYARDHARFQHRIHRTAAILDSVLNKQHRQKIFEERFNVSK